MAIELDKFLEQPRWIQEGVNMVDEVWLPGERSMKIVLSPCCPTVVYFRENGHVVGCVKYIDSVWVGDAPLWCELYDVRALIESKLLGGWELEETGCWQAHEIEVGQVIFRLTVTGLDILHIRADCKVDYKLGEYLPKEIMAASMKVYEVIYKHHSGKIVTNDITAYLQKHPQVIEVKLLYENVRVGDKGNKLFLCEGLMFICEQLADVYRGTGSAKYMCDVEVIR